MKHGEQMRLVWAVLFVAAGLFWIAITALRSSSYDDFCNRIGHDVAYAALVAILLVLLGLLGQVVDKYVFRHHD